MAFDGFGRVTLDWDKNGNLKNSKTATSLVWNWDNKLRTAVTASDTVKLKYDPSGNRIYKDIGNGTTTRKYIVDPVGRLSQILLEIDPKGPGAVDDVIEKTHMYANDQIVAQYDGTSFDPAANKYYYLHDRLGSVRLILDETGDVVNRYTYQPFGELFAAETTETVNNPFKYTGQYHDAEIAQYYLRTRQYDPYLNRFTSRDPVRGKFQEPLTLHRYLYAANNPINRIDPSGKTPLLFDMMATGFINSWRFASRAVSLGRAWSLTKTSEQKSHFIMQRSLEL